MRGYIKYSLEAVYGDGTFTTPERHVKVKNLKISYAPKPFNLVEAGTARPYKTVYFDDIHKIEFEAVYRKQVFLNLFKTAFSVNTVGSQDYYNAYLARGDDGLYKVPGKSVVMEVGLEYGQFDTRAYKYAGCYAKTVTFKCEVGDFVIVSFVILAASREDATFIMPDNFVNTAPATFTTLQLEATPSSNPLTTPQPVSRVKKFNCVFETGFLEANAWIDTSAISEPDFGGESSVICSIDAFDGTDSVASTISLAEQFEGWIDTNRHIDVDDDLVKTCLLSFKDSGKNPLGYLEISNSLINWNYSLSGGVLTMTAALGGVYKLKFWE